MTQVRRWKQALTALHEDESGDVIQTVMVLGIAAVILAVLASAIWPKVRDWCNRELDVIIHSKG